jgi:hypothetical protein
VGNLITVRYITSVLSKSLSIMINLVMVERGASVVHRTAVFNFRCSRSDLNMWLGKCGESRALVASNVGDVSVVGWCCVHTRRTGRGMFRKGCFLNCRRNDGIISWSAGMELWATSCVRLMR